MDIDITSFNPVSSRPTIKLLFVSVIESNMSGDQLDHSESSSSESSSSLSVSDTSNAILITRKRKIEVGSIVFLESKIIFYLRFKIEATSLAWVPEGLSSFFSTLRSCMPREGRKEGKGERGRSEGREGGKEGEVKEGREGEMMEGRLGEREKRGKGERERRRNG